MSGTAITMGEGGVQRVSVTAITMGKGGVLWVRGTAIAMGGGGANGEWYNHLPGDVLSLWKHFFFF